jgi:hypothetical protein
MHGAFARDVFNFQSFSHGRQKIKHIFEGYCLHTAKSCCPTFWKEVSNPDASSIK